MVIAARPAARRIPLIAEKRTEARSTGAAAAERVRVLAMTGISYSCAEGSSPFAHSKTSSDLRATYCSACTLAAITWILIGVGIWFNPERRLVRRLGRSQVLHFESVA